VNSGDRPLMFNTILVTDLPPFGVLVAFRLTQGQEAADSIVLPTGTVIKVPEAVSSELSCSFSVEGVNGDMHQLYAAVLGAGVKNELVEKEWEQGVGGRGSEPRWVLGGLGLLLKDAGCGPGDEVGIERCAPPFCGVAAPAMQAIQLGFVGGSGV
jgi:hypothetical protein